MLFSNKIFAVLGITNTITLIQSQYDGRQSLSRNAYKVAHVKCLGNPIVRNTIRAFLNDPYAIYIKSRVPAIQIDIAG